MDNPFDIGYSAPVDDEPERATATVTPSALKAKREGSIRYYPDLDQGSELWLKARCGLLTASEMKLILTPTLKIASNDKERGHLYELLAQRITGYVEPHYFSDDMLRGQEDEILARETYHKNHAPVSDMGFITNDKWGFTIGYSPDGLVGDHGLIECKSRRQKYQVQTIVECVGLDEIMPEYMMQCQTGMLVSERQWIDHISYSGGLPMALVRVWPDPAIQNAIVEAAGAFEQRLAKAWATFNETVAARRLIPTERRVEQEIF